MACVGLDKQRLPTTAETVIGILAANTLVVTSLSPQMARLRRVRPFGLRR